MYLKLEITGAIEVLSGMHIGGSTAFSAIGAVDSPVVRDVLSGQPLLPGSSLKGKMRTLLARALNKSFVANPDQDDERIIRLFGSANAKVKSGRLIFSDSVISNLADLERRGARTATEVKFENSINRATAVANPRQIERVIRGARFPLEIIYDFSPAKDSEGDPAVQIIEDFDLIAKGFSLLEYDYIGGSGTRGYGRIRFSDLKVSAVIGDAQQDMLAKCNELLKHIECRKTAAE